MEEYPLTNLIEQFLQGTISPEDNQKLQHLIATDTEVAKMVEESKLTYKALAVERRKQLKTKLKSLDENASRPVIPFSKWLGIVILVLGGCFLYLYLSSIYFSPGTIARRNYISYQEFKTDKIESIQQDSLWVNADEAFKNGEYQKAIQQFATLSAKSDSSVSAVARWNILLAQLAIQGPEGNWKIGLDAFEKSAPKTLSAKASDLRDQLDSRYYRFFFFRLQNNLSTIKPRLI